MRILLCYLLSGLCFGRLPAIAQDSPQPFSVTISIESPAVEVGPNRYSVTNSSEIFVTVHLTNTSKTDLSFGYEKDSRTGVCFAHQYELRDSNGTAIPKRVIKHPELGSTGHGWAPRVLKPGESMDISGDHISLLYDISRPGDYTVQLFRAINDDPRNGSVKSNTITFSIAR